MSSFKDLSPADKLEFSEHLKTQILNAYLQRLTKGQQLSLQKHFVLSIKVLVAKELFQDWQPAASALPVKRYTEEQALDAIAKLIEQAANRQLEKLPDASVLTMLLFYQNKVNAVFNNLFIP